MPARDKLMALAKAQLRTNLSRLKHDQWDAGLEAYFKQLSANDLMDALRADFPVVFQERWIGRKHEMGLAREVIYELRIRKMPQSPFSGMLLVPTLRHCFLVSAYDDAVSELTWVSRIRLKPKKGDASSVAIIFGSGTKIDKTVDGWVKKPLSRSGTPLSDEALKKHGWKFDLFQPFGVQSPAIKP